MYEDKKVNTLRLAFCKSLKKLVKPFQASTMYSERRKRIEEIKIRDRNPIKKKKKAKTKTVIEEDEEEDESDDERVRNEDLVG